MALQKINWEQIDTGNIPSGSTIVLGSIQTEFDGIYTKSLYINSNNVYTMITGETANRVSADATLYNQITGETYNRTVSDAYLQSEITGITSNISGMDERVTIIETKTTPISYGDYVFTVQSQDNVIINSPTMIQVNGQNLELNATDTIKLQSGIQYVVTLDGNNIINATPTDGTKIYDQSEVLVLQIKDGLVTLNGSFDKLKNNAGSGLLEYLEVQGVVSYTYTAGSAQTAEYANNAGNASTADNATYDSLGNQIDTYYQPILDNNLTTTDKHIVDAINEVNSIVKNAQKALSFETYGDFIYYMVQGTGTILNVGQSIFIRTLDVPDLWVVSNDNYYINYEYTTDEQFLIDISHNAVIGVCTVSPLETAKVILTDYVPYTGATNDVNLGLHSLTTTGVKLNTTNPLVVSNPGEIGWNSIDGTFDMKLLNNSTLQVGQEMNLYGKAQGNILNGNPVQFAGVQGNHILIKTAVPSEININPHLMIGIATDNIGNNNFGYVTVFGKVNDVFTTGFALGDILYFDSTNGGLTKVCPQAPKRCIEMAAVIKLATGASENGIMMVRVTFGTLLTELEDVDGTPLTTSGQILVWDNTRKVHDFTSNINNYLNLSGGTINGTIKATAYQDLSGNTPFVAQNGGTIYHTTAWTNIGTVSTSGTTVTGSGTSFTSGMIGVKIVINNEERFISTYTSATGVTINNAFSQNYNNVNFAVYNKKIDCDTDTGIYFKSTAAATPTYGCDVNGNPYANDTYRVGNSISLGSSSPTQRMIKSYSLQWANDDVSYTSTKDVGIRRDSANTLLIYDGVNTGTTSNLKLGKLYSYNGITLAQGYISTNGNEMLISNTGNIKIGTSSSFQFASGYDSNVNATDVAIKRSGVNMIEVNNGTTGVYADLKLRNIYASGYTDLNGNVPYTLQNGGTIYHVSPWFVNQSGQTLTISNDGLSVTLANPVSGFQFNGNMPTAKLIVNGVERIVNTYSSVSVLTLTLAFPSTMTGQTYTYTQWGIYSVEENLIGSTKYYYSGSHQGGNLRAAQYIAYNSNAETSGIDSNGLSLGNTTNVSFSSTSAWYGTKDLSIQRNNVGLLEINNGTAGIYRDLILRNLTVGGNNYANYNYSNNYFDNKGNVPFALQNGTILYHQAKWFTPSGNVSSSGTTVTSVGTQFTSAMIGSKLIISGEERLITALTSSSIVTVATAYSQDYSGITNSNWGVYSIALNIKTNGYFNTYAPNGASGFGMDNNGNVNCSTIYGNGSYSVSNKLVGWSDSTSTYSTIDTAIGRNSAGVLEVNNGTAGTYADLKLKNLTTTGVIKPNVDGTTGVTITKADGVTSVMTLNTTTSDVTFARYVFAGNGYGFKSGSRGGFVANSDGVLCLINNTENDFNRLQFGGSTSSFPSLQRSGNTINIVSADGTSSANLFVNGNVGIGTSSPTAQLEINSNTTGTIANLIVRHTQTGVGDQSSYIDVRAENNAKFRGFDAAGTQTFNFGYDSNAGNIATIGYGASNHINITQGGYVGIGTTAPTAKLQVMNGGTNGGIQIDGNAFGGTITSISGSSAGHLYLQPSDNTVTIIGNGNTNLYSKFEMYGGGGAKVYISTNGNSYLNGGNVGIGTTAPSYKLDVSGSTRFGSSTDYATFSSGGTLTLVGNATVFDDVQSPAVDLLQTGSGVSKNLTENTVEYTTNSNLSDYMLTSIQLPHSWKIGSTVFPHLHWEQTTSSVPNLLIQYRWQRQGQAKTTAWTNYPVKINAFTYTTGTLNQITHDSGLVPPANSSLSDIIEFRILRDNANTSGQFTGSDPVGATISVTSFDIHIEKDTLGSELEYIK